MGDNSWSNPWKLTTIGMALMVVTAVVTGLVVANRTGARTDQQVAATTTKPTIAPAGTPHPATTGPSQAAIDACNKYAGTPPSQRDKIIGVVEDATIGAVAGAAVGAVGGAIAAGGKGAGKGAAIGGLIGAGGGTLYGLNELHKHDQGYQDAYAHCMSARGYSG